MEHQQDDVEIEDTYEQSDAFAVSTEKAKNMMV